jgi:hypothetical protein
MKPAYRSPLVLPDVVTDGDGPSRPLSPTMPTPIPTSRTVLLPDTLWLQESVWQLAHFAPPVAS